MHGGGFLDRAARSAVVDCESEDVAGKGNVGVGCDLRRVFGDEFARGGLGATSVFGSHDY